MKNIFSSFGQDLRLGSDYLGGPIIFSEAPSGALQTMYGQPVVSKSVSVAGFQPSPLAKHSAFFASKTSLEGHSHHLIWAQGQSCPSNLSEYL